MFPVETPVPSAHIVTGPRHPNAACQCTRTQMAIHRLAVDRRRSFAERTTTIWGRYPAAVSARREPEQPGRGAAEDLVAIFGREVCQHSGDPLTLGAVAVAGRFGSVATAVHEPIRAECLRQLLYLRTRVTMRITIPTRHGRELHHNVIKLGPAEYDGVLPGRPLERAAHVVDKHADRLELLDVRLEPRRPARLEVELNSQAEVAGEFPQVAKLGFFERRQPIRVVGVHADGQERDFLSQVAHALVVPLAAGKEQAGPFQLSLAHVHAMFEVAVIVLVRLRVNDDRVIDSRPGHRAEQMLGRRGFLRLVRRVLVVGESLIVLAGEAVEVRIDDGRAARGSCESGCRADDRGCDGGAQELASSGHASKCSGCRQTSTRGPIESLLLSAGGFAELSAGVPRSEALSRTPPQSGPRSAPQSLRVAASRC